MTVSRISGCALLLAGVPLLLGSSCVQSVKADLEGRPEGEEMPERDRAYDAERAEVWSAVLESYGDLDLPIETVTPATGRVRSPQVRFPKNEPVGEYMECGSSGLLGDWTDQPDFKAQYALAALVIEQEVGGMLVKARAEFTGQVGNNRMGCASTGMLERNFFKALEARLKVEGRDSETG